jgi:hypothetical protein
MRPDGRRDEREYREYLNEEQRSQPGCSAGRMQLEFHHGLLRGEVAFAHEHERRCANLVEPFSRGPSRAFHIGSKPKRRTVRARATRIMTPAPSAARSCVADARTR